MADFDLPAMFSYIHKVSSQKVSYIGHSQGTIQMTTPPVWDLNRIKVPVRLFAGSQTGWPT